MWGSRRKERLGPVIKEELSKIFLRELDVEPGVIVSITSVEISIDQKKACIYLTFLPSEKEGDIFPYIQKCRDEMQYLLVRRLQMKFVPDIVFVVDKGEKARARIQELIEEAKKKGGHAV